MIGERYKAAIIRGDIETARRLHHHFTVHSTTLTDSAAVADAIRDFLDTEEALTLYSPASAAPTAALLNRQTKPDPRKHPAPKPPGPCHHCGGDHFNRACDDKHAGSYKYKQEHPDKVSPPKALLLSAQEESLLKAAFAQPPAGAPHSHNI